MMRKTAIFLDHENFRICAQNRGIKVDYYDLKNYLADDNEGRPVIEAFCYVAIDPRNQHHKDKDIRIMEEDGWLVKTKMGAPREDGTYKCNVDVEMAMDIISFSYDARPDIVVIVSGDQDFVPVARRLRERGIRAEVASFPEIVSQALIGAASSFINLDVYVKGLAEGEAAEEQYASGAVRTDAAPEIADEIGEADEADITDAWEYGFGYEGSGGGCDAPEDGGPRPLRPAAASGRRYAEDTEGSRLPDSALYL